MKNNQYIFILVGVFFICTLCTAGLLYAYNGAVRRSPETVLNQTVYFNIKGLMQSLGNDTVDYSKRNPAIVPLLQSLMMQGEAVTQAPVSNKPPAK